MTGELGMPGDAPRCDLRVDHGVFKGAVGEMEALMNARVARSRCVQWRIMFKRVWFCSRFRFVRGGRRKARQSGSRQPTCCLMTRSTYAVMIWTDDYRARGVLISLCSGVFKSNHLQLLSFSSK